MGCSDSACAKQIGNSPINVSYTLTVRVTLQATPTTITATAQSGSTTSSSVTVRLPTGSTSFTTTLDPGEQWMNIDQVTASGFRLNMRSLPAGSYNGSIRVSAGTSQVTIPVYYTVAGGAPSTPMTVSPVRFHAHRQRRRSQRAGHAHGHSTLMGSVDQCALREGGDATIPLPG